MSSASFVKWLVACVILADAILLGLAGTAIVQSRDFHRDHAKATVETMARVLADDVHDVIHIIDQHLLDVQDEIGRENAAGGIDSEVLNAFLSRHDARMPDVLGLRVADAQGDVRYAVDGMVVKSPNIGDLSYFNRLRADASAGLVISGPALGRGSLQRLIVLSRRISNPDGSFGGVVLAAVPVQRLMTLLSKVELGAGMSVAVINDSLQFVARHPRHPRVEAETPSSDIPTELRALLVADENSGAYHPHSLLDGVDRTAFFSKVADHPWYVSVGISDEVVLAPWRQQTMTIAGLAAVFVIVTIVLALLAFRTWQQRTQAFAALESVSRLNAAVVSDSVAGICVYKADGTCILGNEAMAGIVGAPLEEILVQNFRQLSSWEREGLRAAADVALTTGTPQHVSARGQSTYGRALWLDVDMSVILMGGERHLLLIARDISEEKSAAERLRISEEKLRGLYDLSPLGFALVDMDGHYIDFNESFRAICGYPEDELKALSYWKLTPDKYAEEEAKHLKALETTGRYGPYEKEYLRKDGTLVPLRLNGVRVTGADGALYIWSIVENITEQRAAELRLKAGEERYRSLVESQVDLVVRVDHTGRFIFVNGAMAEGVGRERSEVLGESWQTFVHPADHAATAAALGSATIAPDFRAMIDNRVLLKNGQRWISWEGAGIHDAEGHVVEVQAVGRDITEWVEHRDRLAKLVDDLDASNRELEQFAYVASHDLREPLRMVNSYIGLLERRYASLFDQDAREFIAFARDGAKRMDGMILDLLEYSRVGRIGDPLAPVALGDIVETAIGNLGLNIVESGATVTVAEGLPTPMGSWSELVRLMQNLIGNAVKYRHPQRPPVVSVGVAEGDGEWVISVTDNCIGIDPQFFDRIFSIFQRLHTRDQYEGTGIGLAICRKIVLRYGGRIWVESQPDEGSTFFFTLPKDGGAAE
jgi:PAS domain S-box-containing protein